MKRSLLFLYLLPAWAFAQYESKSKNAFLNEHIQRAFEHWNITHPSEKFHAAFRPYLSNTYLNAADSTLPFRAYPFRNFFLSKTYNERPEARNWFNVQVHPIVDFEAGYDGLEKQMRVSTAGGAHLKLNINDDFTFALTLVGGNYRLPFYLDTTVKAQRVLPEFGQSYKGTQAGYHFFDYQGYISYSPNNSKYFNFQLGKDKHFIGNGYRSVLLSDFGPAYPFFRINTTVWHLQYNVWYSWMYDVTHANQNKSQFRNKYGTFHYLSWNITKAINIGVFENVVWRGTDTNQVRNFDVNYLSPLVFFRPVEYSLGSPDNAFLGLNASAIIRKRVRLYGQLGLDEFYVKEIRARRGWWANKQAWQLGARFMNFVSVKGLQLQLEYNQARPYTYSHGAPDQNYAHYGYPLAHPLGANFKEYIGGVSYRKNKMELYAQGMFVDMGRDSIFQSSNVGQNIFLSYTTRHAEYGNKTGQGLKTTILQSHLRFTFFILPAINLRMELGYIQRAEHMEDLYELQNPYIYFGLKSGIWNSYKDF